MNFKLAILAIMPLLLLESVARESRSHDKEFWLGIISDGYALPKGEQAYDLLLELNLLLDSPDAVLRDEIVYSFPANWIYRQGLLTDEQLGEQVGYLCARLTAGIGSSGFNGMNFARIFFYRLNGEVRPCFQPPLKNVRQPTCPQAFYRPFRILILWKTFRRFKKIIPSLVLFSETCFIFRPSNILQAFRGRPQGYIDR